MFSREAVIVFYDVFRRPLGDNGSAFRTASGAEVNDPVRALDYIQVVLNDDKCVAGIT